MAKLFFVSFVNKFGYSDSATNDTEIKKVIIALFGTRRDRGKIGERESIRSC